MAENVDNKDSIVVTIPTDTTPVSPPRPVRTRWMKRTLLLGKFSRSHSTEYSPVQQAGESCERFTPRLTEHTRKELLKRRLCRKVSAFASGGRRPLAPSRTSSGQGGDAAAGGEEWEV